MTVTHFKNTPLGVVPFPDPKLFRSPETKLSLLDFYQSKPCSHPHVLSEHTAGDYRIITYDFDNDYVTEIWHKNRYVSSLEWGFSSRSRLDIDLLVYYLGRVEL